MELTINEKVYNFKFGIGFVRHLDGKSSIKQDGIQFGIGLETLIPNLLTGNTVTLSDCLFVANMTENPRITQDQLDNYIDDEETNIDSLFDDVLRKLSKRTRKIGSDGSNSNSSDRITYEKIVENCFRYLDINDIDKINRLTINEYKYLMSGAKYKLVDQQEQIFLLAWAIRQAKSRKKSGRYFYRTFNQFFNRKKIENQLDNKKDTSSLISRIQEAIKVQEGK